MSEPTGGEQAPTDAALKEALELVARAPGLRYGEVRVSVQDGVVVQVERTERFRTINHRKKPRIGG